MDNMSAEKAGQITRSENYLNYEKQLWLEPYIAKMVELLNEHIFQGTKISKWWFQKNVTITSQKEKPHYRLWPNIVSMHTFQKPNMKQWAIK